MPIVVRRLIQLVVVFVVVTFFTVCLISLIPGKPEQVIIPFGTEQQRRRFAAELGLDEPLWIQWWKWVTGFVTGDIGNLYTSTGTRPVWNEIRPAIPVSLALMIYARSSPW